MPNLQFENTFKARVTRQSDGRTCKNYTTSSHAPILHRINSRIHIHLPLPIQEPLPFLRLGCSKLASTSNHHSVLLSFI